MDRLVTESVPASSQQWTASINDQMAALTASVDSQQSALLAAEAAVKRFVAEELLEDVPTGTTPQRRGFSYPRTLTHTKPHSELLEEYHTLTSTSLSADELSTVSVSNLVCVS